MNSNYKILILVLLGLIAISLFFFGSYFSSEVAGIPKYFLLTEEDIKITEKETSTSKQSLVYFNNDKSVKELFDLYINLLNQKGWIIQRQSLPNAMNVEITTIHGDYLRKVFNIFIQHDPVNSGGSVVGLTVETLK